MLSDHLPVLQVVVPLLAAPACVFIRRPRITWYWALGVNVVCVIIALQLLARVFDTGPVSYFLGGWAAPWGIEYRVDTLNAFVVVILSSVSTLTLLFAHDSIEREVRVKQLHLVYTGWLLCLTGVLGIAVTGDAFNVFVFLEIASLSSYLLISLGPDRRALTAAFQYLIVGTIGATFILIGIGLLYMMTGTLNMADLAQRIPGIADTTTVRAAFAFLVVGIAIKAAVFPLHYWLPNAYAYAPAAVSAFMAGTATKVAVYLLLRFLYDVFGHSFSFAAMGIDRVLLPLGIVAALSMSLVAIYQQDLKRLLAFSSVAQIGYMIIGIGLVSVTGLTATILHLFNHALMKSALFLALGCIYFQVGSVQLKAIAGIGRCMPWTMGAFVVGGLSLIGVPMTVGFVSKWYLILAALEQDLWWLAAIVVISSLFAIVYIWKVVETAYFRPLARTPVAEAPAALLVPTWLLIIANVYFGLNAAPLYEFSNHAARQLMLSP